MTNKKSETLGRRIARLRLQHAMTQERLANIANVSSQAVSKWENDQSYPDILLLPLLAKTFGITVDELLGADDSTAATMTFEPEPAPAPQPMPTVEPEPEPILEPESIPMSEPESIPMSEPESIPMPEPEPIPSQEDETGIDGRATRIRLHVIQRGRDTVNLAIPLAAARILSNVVGYFPDRMIEGIDIVELADAVQNAGRGTLIDADDGNAHVTITLE